MRTDKKSTLFRFRERLRIARQGGAKTDISFLLESAQDAQGAEDRVRWLEYLLIWIRLSGGHGTSRQTSLKFLLSRLEQNPEWKLSSSRLLHQIMQESSFVHLFSDMGVHSNYDFIREGVARLVKSLFPAFGDPSHMDTALGRIFHQESDGDWIEELPPELRSQVEAWLFADESFRQSLRERLLSEAAEACSFLCIRASAISLQRELMVRAGCTQTLQVPPLRLRRHTEDFFAVLLANKPRAQIDSIHASMEEEIANSRKYLEDVHAHLEQFGVSVSLVFSLESVTSILNRMETLLQFSLWLRFSSERYDPWALFVSFLRDISREKSVTPLFKSNFHLLSRKIVEKSGATGENYITGNRAEYLSMFYAALGGGFVTAFTGLAKFLGATGSAPFLVGMYAALNYSLSFILMHQLHFKLATKQPAMTAAALAERLRSGSHDHETKGFIELVARISRSQFAAVAGNILAVIPTALAIDFISLQWRGAHVIDAHYSTHMLHTLNPLTTLTIFYAAITGGLLWASGVAAGWLENAYVYYQVPKALSGHPFLSNFLGEERLVRLIAKVTKNLSGWSSSIALGFLLAFVPVTGLFFGLPLDVRHVTLSTGSASYAVSSVGWGSLPSSTLVLTLLGILVIAIMNFGVSFALALYIAVRANDIPRNRVFVILKACLGELTRKPVKFFFP